MEEATGAVPPKAGVTQKANDPAFVRLVEEALARIEDGRFVKAVPARSKSLPLPPVEQLPALYRLLCEAYPQAAIFWASTPAYGEWMGASPEILLEYAQGEAQTVALAGTIDPEDPHAEFTLKEHDEQERVAEFIRQTIDELGLEGRESPVSVERYGPVAHLRSMFFISLSGHAQSREQALALAHHLHPTPAVCGLPRKPALDFLQTHESRARALYAGFWGLASQDRLALFVNLRCMRVDPERRKASLFAGAGVVRGSRPEAELQETERKMSTLSQFLQFMS